MDHINKQIHKLKKVAESYRILGYIEKHTKINKLIILCVFLALLVYISIFALNSLIISRLLGLIYPSIQTVKAVGNSESKKLWLTYWSIYGAVVMIDELTNSSDT